jgi:outer membrane protein assembly factor BamB
MTSMTSLLSRSAALPAILLSLFLSSAIHAADWPQFLGTMRNGVSSETGLQLAWPKEGPPVVWEKLVGEGFSGPVVAGDKLILLHRKGEQDVVECFDAINGKERWQYTYPTTFQDDYGKGDGPRSTPLIDGQHVYTLGADGHLLCLTLDGKKVWERLLADDYPARKNFFGVGTTPVVESKLLLVNVGSPEAGIVAFDKESGKEVWKATSHHQSYSSPVVATLAGQRLAVFFTREGVVLLDPADGKVRFQMRWRARIDASVNAATPLVVGDQVFVTASYDTGALLINVTGDGAKEVWKSKQALSAHYNSCLYRDGYVYGIDGRQEQGASLRCIELKTGKVLWTREGFGCASMILVEGHIIALTENGELVLIEATPDAYREKSRVALFQNRPCRAEIALANGRLYARDGKRLVCIGLKK